MEPIWKDYFIDLAQFFEGGEQFVDYYIEKDGEVIYTGCAYQTPDGNAKIRINDICADYLGHLNLLDILGMEEEGYILDLDAIGVFTIVAGPDQTEVETVTFFNDWSYARLYPLDFRPNLSGTISMEYVDSMPFVYTGERIGIGGKKRIAHYNAPDETLGYKLVQCCNPAVLYFFNANCGWDFLLCKGGAKRVDAFTRATTKRPYNNLSGERGTFNYQNTDKVEWDVMTGWIPNGGGKNLWQLLGSTDVWLFTADEGLVPVVITTNSVEGKDYKLNGRQPVQMTIRVELAQDRQRR